MPHRTPTGPRRSPAAIEPPVLVQFVLLSMLLHLLVILLFGTQSGSGERGGPSWWGPLTADLRQFVPEPERGFTAPGSESVGGFFRRRAPGRETPTGAAPTEPRPTQEAAPPIEPPPEPLPQLHPDALQELDRQYVPTPLPAPAVQPQLLPPVELPLREKPVAPVTPIERIAPQRIEREIAPPLALPPREVPQVPAAPIEQIAPQRIEREIAPPLALPPREVPQVPAAPIEQIAPQRIEREIAPPLALPPREIPVVPAAPLERIAPRSLEPLPESAPGDVAPRLARPVAPAAAPVAPPTAKAAPKTEPATAEPLPRIRLGGPERDESMLKPRRDVVIPSTEPGGVPSIDRDAARERAREIAAKGLESRGVFTMAIPPQPERESKEAKAIEKATKQDCRTAYANLGLLAVPVLVASAIADDSACKW